ncbi:MAG: hypothetical protein WAN43_06040 [Rhodomicrobium sp.]
MFREPKSAEAAGAHSRPLALEIVSEAARRLPPGLKAFRPRPDRAAAAAKRLPDNAVGVSGT